MKDTVRGGRSAGAAALTLALLVLFCVAASAAGAKTVILKSAKKAVPQDGQATLKLPCPKGMHVVSGGGWTFGSSVDDQLAESAPYDGKDDDKKPDDGWLASVNNLRFVDQKMLTFATCSDSLGVVYRHRDSTFTSSGDQSLIKCPDGTVPVGGGLKVDGDPTDAPMAASSPSLDRRNWFTFTQFGRGDGVIYAACAKSSKIKYRTQMGNAPNGQQTFVVASCRRGEKLIGGGAYTPDFGDFGTFDLAALNPSDPHGQLHKPWRRWEGWLNNGLGTDVELDTTAICQA